MARPLAALAALAVLTPSMVAAPAAPADSLSELRAAMLAEPEATVVVRDAGGAREVAAGVAARWLPAADGTHVNGALLGAGAGEPLFPSSACSSIHLLVIAGGYGSNVESAVPAPVQLGAPRVCGRPAETYAELKLLGFGCATATVWVSPQAALGERVCAPYGEWTLVGHASWWELYGFGFSYTTVDAEHGTLEHHAT